MWCFYDEAKLKQYGLNLPIYILYALNKTRTTNMMVEEYEQTQTTRGLTGVPY